MQDQENQAVPNPQADAAAPAEPTLEEQLASTEARLAEMHDAFMRA
ncbi:MAG: nucleotide exchange factor GrpE, partial [Janthinobacterium sp.]